MAQHRKETSPPCGPGEVADQQTAVRRPLPPHAHDCSRRWGSMLPDFDLPARMQQLSAAGAADCQLHRFLKPRRRSDQLVEGATMRSVPASKLQKARQRPPATSPASAGSTKTQTASAPSLLAAIAAVGAIPAAVFISHGVSRLPPCIGHRGPIWVKHRRGGRPQGQACSYVGLKDQQDAAVYQLP